MTLNIQSAKAASSYSNHSESAQSQTRSTDLDLINSVKDLTKAELSGTRVTVGDEQLVKNIEHALNVIKGPDTSFKMSVHKATNTITIKVLNKETGELLREIPPEKTLDLVAKFMEINGILIDERV
ncbi:flagellar protein FlaG [Paenibacillus albus]|uniref:Flagellar protein FlaG n=1 Tax=Paenibacillus albus TaxID=2495582 RepID=A0A3Q8X1S6_9BACL|nr:flagellar protein FlaG [Paenibacillus albus]AZN38522.1 flagellar protein FlaG [Paenibacillus albus]